MTRLWQPVQELARGAVLSLRAALRRGALIGVAGLIAALGAGFLVFAGYLGLRFVLGPTWAALAMGAALLVLSAGVFLMARATLPKTPPPQPSATETPPPSPIDAASMAVFTAAFLLGRRLAERWDTPRNS